jgi:hypothetical protein
MHPSVWCFAVDLVIFFLLLQDWVRSHTLLLTMPKTTDTTITEVSVHNQVRPSVVATVVVPNDDVKKYNGYGGESRAGVSVAAIADGYLWALAWDSLEPYFGEIGWLEWFQKRRIPMVYVWGAAYWAH